MAEAAPQRIHRLEVTDDTLTSRGGLAFFVKYVQTIGIVGLLLSKFTDLKKNRQRGLGREPAVPGAVLLFGRHQPPRKLFR